VFLYAVDPDVFAVGFGVFGLVSHNGREMLMHQHELFILEHQSPLSTQVRISKQTDVKLRLKKVINYRYYLCLPP
jgi:hypothetical protein